MEMGDIISIVGSVITCLLTIASLLWGLGTMRGRVEEQLRAIVADLSEIKAGRIAPCVQHSEQIGRLRSEMDEVFHRLNTDHRHTEPLADC